MGAQGSNLYCLNCWERFMNPKKITKSIINTHYEQDVKKDNGKQKIELQEIPKSNLSTPLLSDPNSSIKNRFNKSKNIKHATKDDFTVIRVSI